MERILPTWQKLKWPDDAEVQVIVFFGNTVGEPDGELVEGA